MGLDVKGVFASLIVDEQMEGAHPHPVGEDRYRSET
jgi:hypothetical protein